MKQFSFRHTKEAELMDSITAKTKEQSMSEQELFSFAEFHKEDVERTGYSNYSYWGSTLRVFAKNKVAMILVILLAALLLFTFIQPHLPGQGAASSPKRR